MLTHKGKGVLENIRGAFSFLKNFQEIVSEREGGVWYVFDIGLLLRAGIL